MFEVRIKIDREEDLYCGFDEKGLTLSEDVLAYMTKALEGRRRGEKLRLCFASALDLDEGRLEKAIGQYMESVGKSVKRHKRSSWLNSLRLLAIGVIFVVLGLVFENKMGAVAAAIVSTIGSFSVWEAANVWIQEFPLIRAKERAVAFLQQSELVIEDAD